MFRKLLAPMFPSLAIAASLALTPAPAHAEVWQARYGVAETFNFKLYNADGTLDVDEADGGTEVSVSCNEGAETTATNDFVDEGTFYSIALTSGEMSCERIAVVIAATTTEVFFIQTNSNASAMTPANDVNLVNIGGSAVSTSTAQLGVNVVNAGATAWGSGAITANSIATDAITAAKIAADAIAASEIAADAIGAAEIANSAIDAATFASGAIDAAAIATDAIGAAEIAASAIAAAEIADGAIDEATYATTAGAFASLGVVDQGTAQAATGTTLQLRSAAAFADDEIIGATCVITGGSTGVGQSRTVTDYVSSTDTATVATWTTTPTGTIVYKCFGTAAGASGSVSIAAGGITSSSFASGAIDATAIAADAIGASELAADAIGASEVATDAIGAAEIAADAIGSSELATGAITTAEFASGAINAAAIATDAIGAAEVASDVSTEFSAAVFTVNAIQLSGDATAADNLETAYDDTAGAVRWAGIADQGTAQSATSTTIVLRSAAAFANSELVGMRVFITGGSTGVGQSRLITGYVGSTDTATVSAWTTTPSGTITYQVVSDTAAAGGSAPTAAEVADAVWDEATSGHTSSGTFGEQVKTDIDDILVDTSTTLDDLIDTEVAAIKAKTDQLTFGVTGEVNANMESQNAAAVCGNGTSGDKWRACP